MGLMNSLSRGISQAANAGADIYARGALEDQRAEIQTERDARLAELQEGATVRQENRGLINAQAPLKRLSEVAQAEAAAGMNSDQAVASALDKAKVNDPAAYLAGRPLASEKTVTIPDGAAVIDPRTGKVIFQNGAKNEQAAMLEAGRNKRAEDDRKSREGIAERSREAKSEGKALPISAAKALLDNQTNLRRAQTALALASGETVDGLKGDTDATGKKGWVPNQVLNRMDPAGVDTRAAIADLGSLVIHDRSGAAVTASEFPRLAPFIPTEKDDAATVKKKLTQFTRNYQAVIDDTKEFYQASGYKVPTEVLRSGKGENKSSPASPAVQVQSAADVEALPSGAIFTTPDGKTRRKP